MLSVTVMLGMHLEHLGLKVEGAGSVKNKIQNTQVLEAAFIGPVTDLLISSPSPCVLQRSEEPGSLHIYGI